ncbi:MAG: NYN domain-containing protein [Chloroflexi bacterium]|nr:NYN domain-containing protein [Chloroflexota bacterium]
MRNKRKEKNYAFIDGANLHLGVKAQGWRMDYKKFRLYLKNKYRVSKAFIFIGWVEDNQQLYEYLKQDGFELVFKPTIPYMEKGSVTYKGNVDAELVLHAAAVEYDNYDQAVVVTSDGDFACLIEFLIERKKLKKIITPTGKYSSLMGKYRDHIVLVKNIKSKIADRSPVKNKK